MKRKQYIMVEKDRIENLERLLQKASRYLQVENEDQFQIFKEINAIIKAKNTRSLERMDMGGSYREL